jgi:peptidase E
MAERHIVAMGGYSLGTALDDYLLALARGPRVCFLPTAMGDAPQATVAFYESYAHRSDATHVAFHPWPPANLRDVVLTQHLVLVGGGNTANMLAVWRTHGLDAVLREAWESGIVLAGWSAGMICWFEAGVTDSFGPQLEAMDCLGFLPGSACPHYDGEELRRPRYRELLAAGMSPGYAVDDDAALHFVGTEVSEAVTALPGKHAYRVASEGERPLETRLL